MIPNSPLLKRVPYSSPIAGAQYDPFTLFIKYEMKNAYFVLPNASYGNTETNDEFIQEMIDSEASSFHEELHWFQYNSTTVGAFLALLRYSQERTVINVLAGSHSNSLSKLMRQRLQKNAHPIVPLDDEGRMDLSLLDLEDPLNIFCQMWYDHLLIYSIFNSSEYQDNISYPRGQVFGEVASDLILHFCDRCGFQFPELDLTRKWFKFDEEEVVFVSLAGKRLTTLGILESLTTANELQLLLYRESSAAQINKFIDSLGVSNYGIALFSFMRKMNFDVNNLEGLINILPTFNTICDVALNPPLPPFFIGAPEYGEHWHWNEIYPPLRLIQLLDAIDIIGLLPPNSQHEQLYSYIDALCAYLHWPSPNSYVHPFKKCNGVIDFERVNYDPDGIKLENLTVQVVTVAPYMPASYDPNRAAELFGLPKRTDTENRDFKFQELSNFDYYHYLFWVQFKMWEKRKKNLPSFINPVECRYKEEMFHYYEDLNLRWLVGSIWTRPPFVWCADDDNNWGFGTAYQNFNAWLLMNSCFHYFLFDFVARTGKFDTSAYPPEMRELKIFDSIREGFEQLFNIKIDKEILTREFTLSPLFTLGDCVGTPKVLEALKRNKVEPDEYLRYHVTGNWGVVGKSREIYLSAEEEENIESTDDLGKLNKWGIKNKESITSIYYLPDKTKFWITTESGWKYTVLYLPEER